MIVITEETQPVMPRNSLLTKLGAVLTLLAGAPAKTAPADAAASSPKPNVEQSAPIELSPFVISEEKNTGYQAHNTLAGTRLNSKLDDLAASITVVTKEQLLDTAAVDINDVFLYEASTEGTGQFTDFLVDSADRGNVLDNVQTSPQMANRVRGLSAANIARGNFGATGSIPIDTYNVDAIEISRGPNSNIFGLGDAAGTVNIVTSKAGLGAGRSAFTARMDNWSGHRGTFDLNRPLRKDVFAIRLQGMSEEKGYKRKPSTDRANRLQASFAARPFPKTMIWGSYETYHNYNQRPNSLTPRDGVSEWRTYGSPTWDPVTFRAQVNGAYTAPIPVGSNATAENLILPPGLYSDSNRLARPAMFIDGGRVQLYTNQRVPQSTVTRIDAPQQANADPIRYMFSGTLIQRGGGILGLPPLPLYALIGVNDRSIYDWESINVVASNWGRQKADTYQLELEHFFVNNSRHLLGAQLGWMREDSDRLSRNVFGQLDGGNTFVYVDVNERHLDGSPNPYFLRPFIGGFQPTIMRWPERNENYRGVLAYQLDWSDSKAWQRHLGRHRLAGFAEYRNITNAPNGLRYRDRVVSDHAWVTAANRDVAGANIYPRYYIGGPVNQPGPVVDYGATRADPSSGDFDMYWYQSATKQWTNERVRIDEVYSSQTPAERVIRTRGVSYQGFFWGDRIVPTLGVRRDSQSGRASIGGEMVPATGFPNPTNLFDAWGSWTKQQGTTTTAGLVVKPLPWLYFHYNKADSFRPAEIAYNLFGEQLPNPTGTGKDYGLTLTALKGKLVLRYNQYETDENDKRGTIGVLSTRTRNLDSDSGDGTIQFDLEDWLTNEVAAWQPGWTPQQQRAEVLRRMNLDEAAVVALYTGALNDVNNATSKGKEIEISYNPNRFLTLKANIAQQKAIDSDLSPNLQRYLNLRMPTWLGITSPVNGRSWWTDNNNQARNAYELNVLASLKLALTTQGKAKPQTREWRANVLGKYRLAGLGVENWLKDANVGGAVRWEDRGAIGFFGGAPDADGAVRELDSARPIFDSARTYLDFMCGYSLRLFKGRTRTDLQLNVRNVFEDGRLQVVGVNPDGRPFNFRIIDPRQFIFTVSFEL